jgi:hypothetical protein
VEYRTFMTQAPAFEEMLLDSGTTVTKLWFSVTQQEQRTRVAIRQDLPRTFLGQPRGQRAPDAARRSGHEHPFAAQADVGHAMFPPTIARLRARLCYAAPPPTVPGPHRLCRS